MKLAILLASISAASAFAPSASRAATSNGMPLSMTEETETVANEAPVEPEPATPAYPTLNGWTPDPSLPCFGLPGVSAPLGFFDPLGFSKDKELTGAKRLREAEIMHGRVGMMAVVGFLIGENTPTIAYGMTNDHTIANDQIPEIPGTVLFPFFLAINIAEAYRAAVGWVEPGLGPLWTLREGYYPGDLGFDPFGLKPTDPKAFANMQTKEINNGRLVCTMCECLICLDIYALLVVQTTMFSSRSFLVGNASGSWMYCSR